MKRLVTILFLWATFIFAEQQQRRVIIVGGGLAGLSAAIEAYRYGAEVVLLDKEARIGGNSKKASSGINAVCTPPQVRKKVSDSVEIFARDTIASGKGCSNNGLVKILAQQSRDAWQFLASFGVDLELVSQTGGHSIARTHRAQENKGKVTNIGIDIIDALSHYIDHCALVTIINDARVTELLKDKANQVCGVKLIHQSVQKTIKADAVILATGGYCGQTDSKSLLAQCRPDLAKLGTTNGNCASGDGIGLGCQVGASLVDMDKVQVHPTGFVHPQSPNELRKFLAPESLRASGGILLNHHGKRFVNELGKRDEVTNAILAHCGPYRIYGEESPTTAYLVLNEAGAQLFQKQVLDFYQRRGFVQTVRDASALGDLIKTDPQNIKKTFEKYTEGKEKGIDEFGKTTFPITFKCDEPLYVMLITPCLHYSMGGLKFDEQARVLAENRPIKNLFAAGEVTGGLHGANRLCGNSLLECVVFGRIAGKNAAMNV